MAILLQLAVDIHNKPDWKATLIVHGITIVGYAFGRIDSRVLGRDELVEISTRGGRVVHPSCPQIGITNMVLLSFATIFGNRE